MQCKKAKNNMYSIFSSTNFEYQSISGFVIYRFIISNLYKSLHPYVSIAAWYLLSVNIFHYFHDPSQGFQHWILLLQFKIFFLLLQDILLLHEYLTIYVLNPANFSKCYLKIFQIFLSINYKYNFESLKFWILKIRLDSKL